MRKGNFLFAAAAGLMLFTACSNNEDLVNDGSNSHAGEQIITLQVLNTNMLQTRAGRPLENSDPGQSIENVKLFLTDVNHQVVWVKDIDDWQSSSGNSEGKERQIVIPKTECRMTSGATYHIFAVGYSNDSEYDIANTIDLAVGDTFSGDAILPYHGEDNGEEIFAGHNNVIGDTEGVKASVILERQVAGVFVYVDRIPYVTDLKGENPATTLKLVTSTDLNRSLVIGRLDREKFVVNGTAPERDRKELFNIRLTEWFGADIKEDTDDEGKGNGLIDAENWVDIKDKGYRKGSVFAGSFLIPFQKNTGNTLQLVLTNDDGSAQLVWSIILPQDAKQLVEGGYSMGIWDYNNQTWTITPSVTDTRYQYNVLRNCLYSVGEKNHITDRPTPLNNKQELAVTVNQNWEAIYNMGVD